MAQAAKRLKARPPDDYVVNDLNFQELAGTDQIPRDFDVRLARRCVPARVIVLCEAPSYVQSPIGGADVNSFHRDGGGWLYFPGWMR